MSTDVLTSSDREAVVDKLETGPNLPGDVPNVLRIVINWITSLFTSLIAYVSDVMSTNAEQIHYLQDRLDELEASVPSQPTQPTPTPQQPSRPSPRASRCQRCHATGHGTTDCRTRDPVVTKKRIANNQKIKKAAINIIPPSPYPRLAQPHSYFYQPPPPSSYPAIAALAVDAQELRRRKVQSTRDKRRKAAVPPHRLANPGPS